MGVISCSIVAQEHSISHLSPMVLRMPAGVQSINLNMTSDDAAVLAHWGYASTVNLLLDGAPYRE